MSSALFTVDLRTLFIVSVLACLSFGTLQIGMWAVRRRESALLYWGLSNLLGALSYLLIGLRGLVPDTVSIVGANGVAVMGHVLMWAGLRQFARQPLPWPGLLLLPVLLMAMLTGIEPLASDLRLRLILSSVEIAVFAAAVLRDARRAQRSEPLRMRQVAMGLYLSTLLVGLIRLAVVLHDVDMPPDYLDRRSPEAPFALVLMVVALAWNFSITLMVGERMEARLQGLAHTDPLSGLLNRAGFRERSRRQLERARRELKPVSVMLLDLDHFKRINDTYGHDAGDAMLAGFAKLLQETVRPGDLTSRHGGEEFCALLPGADAPAAAAVAERIRARFEQLRVPAGPDRIGTTVCIGVAQWAGGDETIERALKRADAALYSAKREGRNRVVLAAPADGVAAAPA